MEVSDYFPMWDRLSAAQREGLTARAAVRCAKKGAVIQNSGMECRGLLLVRTGQLRAYILSAEGREITIYRLFERDICLFSASRMMRSVQFDITIEAEKDTEFFLIPAEDYKAVMDESAPLANFTNEVMASRFSDVMWLMEQVMWQSFDKRLAAFLLEEALLEDSDCLKLTHEAIGNHLGNPREVVTRMLHYFQSEGMVKLARGQVELTDRDKLEALQNG